MQVVLIKRGVAFRYLSKPLYKGGLGCERKAIIKKERTRLEKILMLGRSEAL
jgi:hypothetical protein